LFSDLEEDLNPEERKDDSEHQAPHDDNGWHALMASHEPLGKGIHEGDDHDGKEETNSKFTCRNGLQESVIRRPIQTINTARNGDAGLSNLAHKGHLGQAKLCARLAQEK
jgi:hypothetical protein